MLLHIKWKFSLKLWSPAPWDTYMYLALLFMFDAPVVLLAAGLASEDFSFMSDISALSLQQEKDAGLPLEKPQLSY